MQAGAMEAAFRVHLMGCSVCREEAPSLATLVAPNHGLDPSRAAPSSTRPWTTTRGRVDPSPRRSR